jgi:hypothetical protein
MLTFPEIRDPQAEAVITGGLAAFNLERFGRVDPQTLDILVHDDNSGDISAGSWAAAPGQHGREHASDELVR